MSSKKKIGGTQYSWEKKNDKINVYIEKTAQGQTTVAGTYDIKSKTWQNSRRKITVPSEIKTMIEILCDKKSKPATI